MRGAQVLPSLLYEAVKEVKTQRAQARREASKWQRKVEARNAEGKIAESNKAKISEWSFSALIFWIFLGWLLFHK